MVAVVAPLRSGLASGETTSLKLGDERANFTPLALLVSYDSPGLRSNKVKSPFSLSRVSIQELVALVLGTETERIFSILKKSLFSQDSGLGSMLVRVSEISQTFGGFWTTM